MIWTGLLHVGLIAIPVVDQALDIYFLFIEEIEHNAAGIPTGVTILSLGVNVERMIVKILDCQSFCNTCLLCFEQHLPFGVVLFPGPLDSDGTETSWAFIAAASIDHLAVEAASVAAYQIPDFHYSITLVGAS